MAIVLYFDDADADACEVVWRVARAPHEEGFKLMARQCTLMLLMIVVLTYLLSAAAVHMRLEG